MPFNATTLAFITISLWSFLAYLGTCLVHVPPFLLVGIALCFSGFVGAVRIGSWRVSLKTFAVGIGGIFGYHFMYFTALQHAPPVEANLINYLWPLLTVVLSPVLLTGYALRLNHIIGAVMGFIGTALIVTGGRLGLDMANISGYLYAAGAALAWSSYSLFTKRLSPFPTAAVGGFCLISGLLSLGIHFILEERFVPNTQDWIYLILLGAGPMGAAFFTWDAALKRGDPRIIGSLMYLTPITSTLILVLAGGYELKLISALAMMLIVSGAAISAVKLFRSST